MLKPNNNQSRRIIWQVYILLESEIRIKLMKVVSIFPQRFLLLYKCVRRVLGELHALGKTARLFGKSTGPTCNTLNSV